MDMYEINSRRRNRRAGRRIQPDDYPFKSIPNLSVEDYDCRDFYSLAPGTPGGCRTLETRDRPSGLYRSLDNAKMYRSLGYIPSTDQGQLSQYEEEVKPTKSQTGTLARKKTPTVPIMSGTLNYKLDRIFSRWQQHTFVLTSKSLKCYERSLTSHHPSLLWKVKLSNIENMDLTTKKGHLTIRLSVHKESHRVLLRSVQDTRIWFNMMMNCCNQSAVRTLSRQQRARECPPTPRECPPTPSRSEAIQSWLLGRPSIAKVTQLPQSSACQYQPHSWGPTISSTKHRNTKRGNKSPGRHQRADSKSYIGKQESQDSGNSSLSTATHFSSTNVYNYY